MNKQMTLLWNRVNDAIYSVCMQENINYEQICKIQTKVKRQFELNRKKENPYLKKLNETNRIDQILKGADKYNVNEFINSLSLSLRDVMLILESKREQINQIKKKKSISAQWITLNEERLNRILSELLVYQDVLLDLESCSNELEMNQIIQRMINESE